MEFMTAVALGKAAAGAGTAATSGLFGTAGQFAAGQALATTAAVGGAGLQVASGQAQKKELKIQAAQEREAAKDREHERQRRVLMALSANRAAAAGRGVAPSSGSEFALEQDIHTQSGIDRGVDSRNTALRGQMLRGRGKVAARTSVARAGVSLFDHAARRGEIGN